MQLSTAPRHQVQWPSASAARARRCAPPLDLRVLLAPRNTNYLTFPSRPQPNITHSAHRSPAMSPVHAHRLKYVLFDLAVVATVVAGTRGARGRRHGASAGTGTSR